MKTNAANLSPCKLGRVKDLDWSKIIATNNRFEALSPDKDDSSGIQDDETVKTSNCRTVQAEQATSRAITSKRRRKKKKKKKGKNHRSVDAVESGQGEQTTPQALHWSLQK